MKFISLPPSRFLSPMRLLDGLLITCLLIGGCTRDAGITADLQAPDQPNPSSATQPFDPADRNQYRYLYVVYCNGTVDRLDLVLHEKVDSFHLSERSGDPPAVAALSYPRERTEVCLSRPVATGDTQDQAAGIVNIVASDTMYSDSDDGSAPFRLLTFTLPDWTLQGSRDLGHFDVLNSPYPNMQRMSDGSLALRPRGNPFDEMSEQVKTYIGGERLEWPGAIEWSADNVLLRYALSERGGTGIALANHSRSQIIRVAEFPRAQFPISPESHLAPGGGFVLLVMFRSVPLGKGIEKVENTGELRLYDADGHLVNTFMEPEIEGDTLAQIGKLGFDDLMMYNGNDWDVIALTPNGLAVLTDRRRQGHYHFIELGHTFGVEPVMVPDYQPGLVYASQ